MDRELRWLLIKFAGLVVLIASGLAGTWAEVHGYDVDWLKTVFAVLIVAPIGIVILLFGIGLAARLLNLGADFLSKR